MVTFVFWDKSDHFLIQNLEFKIKFEFQSSDFGLSYLEIAASQMLLAMTIVGGDEIQDCKEYI